MDFGLYLNKVIVVNRFRRKFNALFFRIELSFSICDLKCLPLPQYHYPKLCGSEQRSEPSELIKLCLSLAVKHKHNISSQHIGSGHAPFVHSIIYIPEFLIIRIYTYSAVPFKDYNLCQLQGTISILNTDNCQL